MRAINQSRMTLTFVPILIDGMTRDELDRYFGNLVNVRENAETLCSVYHGFPDYKEMYELVRDYQYRDQPQIN